ncbi:hypothetical protein QR680_014355 [Steinernema hermaphroditum]|uniref:Serpentine receptor class gamma n=1 Tax=Steinernema hermaphroditum TaxID=289476 RepID=A0AA39IAS2_9BILA|nr:hypothetical protein QR680_014355 [Steinernema hermaphroditum]
MASDGNTLKIVLFYVTVGYSIPCYIAHFITIYVLSARRFRQRFKYSFYKLFKLQCLLIVQLMNATVIRLPFSNLFNDIIERHQLIREGAVPTIGHFLFYYLLYASLLNGVLISLNRIIVMVLPTTFRDIWRRSLPYLIVFLFLLPLLLTWHLVVGGSYFVYSKEALAYRPTYNNIFGIKNSSYVFHFHVVIDTFVLVIDLIIIGYVIKNRVHEVDWPELKLFLLSLANFVLQGAQGGFQAVAFYGVCPTCYVTNLLLHPILIDIICFVNPWFLLVSSAAFRQSVKEVFRVKARKTESRVKAMAAADGRSTV